MANRGERALQNVGLISALLLLLGCGARTEYLATSLEIDRVDWDSVRVYVSYAARKVIGGDTPIEADSTVITLFDARYDTLYSGAPGTIPVPDAALGNRERLMVEACGLVKRRQMCAQQLLESSPKRLTVAEEIMYPRAGDLEEGSYDFSFGVERPAYDGEGWERIETQDVNGHLLAWVDGPEAKARGVLRIPFSRPSGSFTLSRYSNYRNFKYYLDSALLDHQSAKVTFEIHAGLSEAPVRLASTTKEVHRKSDDDRALEVRYFAEQATEMIIDELGSYPGSRSAFAYVQDWQFTSMDRSYLIELEVEWDGPRFDRGRHEVEGVLQVREDGSGAAFRIESGNRRAVRKWRARTDENTLPLGRLDVFRADVAEWQRQN